MKKDENKFWKEMSTRRTILTKALKPRADYTKEYDMFSLNWGQSPIDSTIEVNLLSEGDLRFDVTKDGIIVGLEIENLTKVLKEFNCDKRKPRRRRIKRRI
jgi:hypothetical protein